MTSFENLGNRICIIGPSNAGKSTLALAIASKTGLPVCHLDQIAHIPHSNWVRRPIADFIDDHDKTVATENWIIEGNYSLLMPERFARATSVIWLGGSFLGFIYRYFHRCMQTDKNRAGNLPGATSQLSWALIKYMLFQYPKNKQKYEKILANYPALPVIRIKNMRELNAYYKAWQLY
jgi:adenylate kinase family enzyme